jgi:hypothetical protein
MNSCRLILMTGAIVLCALAAATDAADLDKARLTEIQQRLEAKAAARQGDAFLRYRAARTGGFGQLNTDPRVSLMAVLPSGRPMYYTTHNLDAAVTVATDLVWPGGSTGLSLTGANTLGELAIWDGGVVRTSHQEFGGRVVVMDGNTNLNNHATHVAGTMVAAGVDVQAGGMSPAANLGSYFWDDDEIEMAAAAAAGLRLSNHSYGWIVGWQNGYLTDDWYWFGDPAVSELEDPGFGFYAGGTAEWDQIAHAAPNYLIVKSAGNDRDDFGPGPGGGHYVWDYDLSDWAWSTATRDGDGGGDGFDSIGYRGNAKNILTVGAVDDIPGGWSTPSDVVASGFTSWGPTDDGRIKPDLVTNGVALYSSLAGSDTDYATYSGTSMAAPTATGSLNLLLQHYESLLGATPLASTLKALVLHTTDEAGPAPGPDYMHGWGLLNTARAALVISDEAGGGRRFEEGSLANGEIDTYRFYHDGTGRLVFTLAWTDPAGTPPPWSLDPTTPMLVNDLDLRVVRESDGAILRPWRLDPANPALPADTGENHRDNVETVDASGAGEGAYTVQVRHSGTLSGGQAYSLVQTGGQRISVTDVAADVPAAGSRLLRAAPNPFNPRTEISLAIARTGRATVAVYDARGRMVAELLDGELAAGEHRVAWNGQDTAGRSVAAGVYLVRLNAGDQQDSLRISLVK